MKLIWYLDCVKWNLFGTLIVNNGTYLVLGKSVGCRLAECWMLANLEDVFQSVKRIVIFSHRPFNGMSTTVG